MDGGQLERPRLCYVVSGKTDALRLCLIVILLGWPMFLMAYDLARHAQIAFFTHGERFWSHAKHGTVK
jgi:hypothetical protein